MRIQKSCINCRNAVQNNFNNDLICRHKGVVSRDFTCVKHRCNPESTKAELYSYRCIDCNFLMLEAAEVNTTMGYCQLFTVRHFDGTKKNICSKFILKSNPVA